MAGACSSSVAEAAQACRAQASPRWPEGGSAQHLLLLELGGNVVLLVGDLQVGDEQHGDALPPQLLHMSCIVAINTELNHILKFLEQLGGLGEQLVLALVVG